MKPTNTETKEACERSIVLAADSVSKLRLPDVMRVMEDYLNTHGSTSDIVDYIIDNRPDLTCEAIDCQLELVHNVCPELATNIDPNDLNP